MSEKRDKTLVILLDHPDLKALDPSLLQGCDRLALSFGAMLSFEESNLDYLTFNDFYDYRQFRVDNMKLIEESEQLFSLLDKKYEPFIGFPRAFTGHIYWFLTFFADICYMSRICEKIKETYGRCYLVAGSKYNVPFKIDMEFSYKELNFAEFCCGLVAKAGIIKAILNPECIRAENFYNEKQFNFGKEQLTYLIKKACKKILYTFEEKVRASFFKCSTGRKGNIFVIQDGYELSYLKRDMPGFLYIKPVEKLLGMARNNESNKTDLDYLFNPELKEFIKRWFPDFEKYIFDLFNLYHDKVLSKINFLSKEIESLFRDYKPSSLFFSIFASRIHEDVFAYYANQKNVPVFYFQHGGTPLFLAAPYEERYLEQNRNIEKVSLFHSRVEKDFFAERRASKNYAPGSITLYDLYQRSNKNKSRKKRVLYCPGIPPSAVCRNFMNDVNDRAVFDVNKDVIDVAGRFNLKMDVKVHPYEEGRNYLYFRELSRKQKSGNLRVLKGFPAEYIIKKYGLLILDCPTTTLFQTSMVLDIPVLLYFKDISFLRKEIVPDIMKRYYLVRSKGDLERYIRSYENGKLNSKFSLEFVDRYSFPVNNGNPRYTIAECINKHIDQKDKRDLYEYKKAV